MKPLEADAPRTPRNRTFDLVRILFAVLVLLSHAPELCDGNRLREPLTMLAHTPMSFGTLAVDGFFLLSGYLMVQSWESDRHVLNFMRKRVLRIVPGYAVATLLSVLGVGLLAPGVPHFFARINWPHLAADMLLLQPPTTPPVAPGVSLQSVNGALWTIAYEFRCYLLIALLGALTLLRRPVPFLLLTAGVCGLAGAHSLVEHLSWHGPISRAVLGDTILLLHFSAIYLVGAGYHVLRAWIPFRPWIAAIIAVVLLSVPRLHPAAFERATIFLGSYLLFALGRTRFRWAERLHRLPDLSYGIYLYGWPVETLLVFYLHGPPWLIFINAVAACFLLGWLSWHLVERPALKLKRRTSAPLPAG